MDWVHCNKCFKNVPPLYCQSCSHILCDQCARRQCPMCQKSFQPVEIGKNMPFSVRYFFEDISQAIQRLQKAIKFQFEHRTNLEKGKLTVLDEIKKLKETKAQLEKNSAILEECIKKETEDIKKMQTYIEQCERRDYAEAKKSSFLFQKTPQQSYLRKALLESKLRQTFERKELNYHTPELKRYSDSYPVRRAQKARYQSQGRFPFIANVPSSHPLRNPKLERNATIFCPSEEKRFESNYGRASLAGSHSHETGYSSYKSKPPQKQNPQEFYLDSFKFGSLF